MKLLKFLILTIMLISMLCTVGCASDKFVGTWYGANNNSIDILTIEKDSNNYLIRKQVYLYQQQETKVEGQAKKVDVICYPGKIIDINFQGQEKDGNLFVNPLCVYTYISKDNSLRLGNIKYYSGSKDILKKVQEEVKDNVSKKMEKEKKMRDRNSLMSKINTLTFDDELRESKR